MDEDLMNDPQLVEDMNTMVISSDEEPNKDVSVPTTSDKVDKSLTEEDLTEMMINQSSSSNNDEDCIQQTDSTNATLAKLSPTSGGIMQTTTIATATERGEDTIISLKSESSSSSGVQIDAPTPIIDSSSPIQAPPSGVAIATNSGGMIPQQHHQNAGKKSSPQRKKLNDRVKMFQNNVLQNWKNKVKPRIDRVERRNGGGGGVGLRRAVSEGQNQATNMEHQVNNNKNIGPPIQIKKTDTSSDKTDEGMMSGFAAIENDIFTVDNSTDNCGSDGSDSVEEKEDNKSEIFRQEENSGSVTINVSESQGPQQQHEELVRGFSNDSGISHDSSSILSRNDLNPLQLKKNHLSFQRRIGNRVTSRRQQSQSSIITTSNSSTAASIPTQVSESGPAVAVNLEEIAPPRRSHIMCNVRPSSAYAGVQMKEADLYKEMLRTSDSFEELKSSSIGSQNQSASSSTATTTAPEQIGTLRVEVLSCLGIPKISRGKPNAVAYLICGDVPFATDIITSSHSPIWPARSKRAAIFPIYHAFAKLYVGVLSATDRENDDFIGRTALDIAVIRPNSLYDVTLPLKVSSVVYDDQSLRGVIRLRFSLHFSCGERAAILSYVPNLKEMKNGGLTAVAPTAVTIPCADPKALRNVAFAVHGEDLPGTYSRKAWRAAAREAALYKLNLGQSAHNLIIDIMSYENVYISSYLFIGWMLITYFKAATMAPPFFVSFLIAVFIENHFKFNNDPSIHCGYAPPTLKEICMALLLNSGKDGKGTSIEPLEVGDMEESIESSKNCDIKFLKPQSLHTAVPSGDDEPIDHVEFPYSHRRYQKLPIRKMLLENSGSTTMSRLENSKCDPQKANESDKFAVESFDTNDTFKTTSDGQQHLQELDDEDTCGNDSTNDADGENESKDFDMSPSLRSKRYLMKGPEQSDSVNPEQNEGKAFQENFNALGAKMHNVTWHLFEKEASRPIRFSQENDGDDEMESLQGIVENEKGLLSQTKYGNPLVALTAKFLEPVMKCKEIYLASVRAGFSIATWRDPYISTWILLCLVVLMAILIVFPWRLFFFVTGIVGLGPQNLFFRLQRERKEASNTAIKENNSQKTDEREEDQKKRMFRRRNREGDQSVASPPLHLNENYQRPLFKARLGRNGQKGNKKREAKYTPQEVIIPYSRLKQERFFFWPPYEHASLSTDITGMESILSLNESVKSSQIVDGETKSVKKNV